ncbi:ATP-binding protein [Streptomyces cellulosae]
MTWTTALVTPTHADSPATNVRVGHELCIQRDPASVLGAITESDALWPGRLRRVARAALLHWQRQGLLTAEELLPAEELLTAELVTNALRHGSGPEIGYRLYLTATHLVTEVRDGSPDLPVLRCASPNDEHGRGLFLVNAMADAWGVSPDGTTTWCSLSLRKGSDAPMEPVASPVPTLRRYPAISLPGDASAASRVRTIARTGITVMGWKGSVHAGTEVVGLLAQNAVQHAVTDSSSQRVTVNLQLSESEQLIIDVHDPAPRFPGFQDAVGGEQGRGLWEAQQHGAAITWFLDPEAGGKVVRATMTPGVVEP